VRIEDYIEVIYELIQAQGEASPGDIATHLHVSKPTVTKMLQRLDEAGLVLYERYSRAVELTSGGESLAQMLHRRHGVIAEFLRQLGLNEETVQTDTEGIEHHLHPDTLERLSELSTFIKDNPGWWQQFNSA
jgi:Mn-dependent DtxR family transcriptional regulator